MLKSLAFLGPLGYHILPGIIVLIISVAFLAIWEFMRLTSTTTGPGPLRVLAHWLIPSAGIMLGVMSCILIAARFAAVA